MGVVLVATVPWLGKPLHMDDPADLQYVQQILRSPFDPYGFDVDWDEGPRPAFRNYHPPLKYYYHALILAVLPPSELVLHATMIPFVFLTAWAVLSLARRFRCSPILLLLLWMLGPGYLPGQNAMLDVPAIALGLAATALWIEAVDSDRLGRLALAGAILGTALLTKYSALMYVPVWVAYLGVRGRFWHWLMLAVPGAILALWCGWTAWRYGQAHPRILFGGVPGHVTSHVIGERILPAIVFLGGAMPAVSLVGCFRSRPGLVILAIAGLIALGVFLAVTPQRNVVSDAARLTPINSALWWFFAATGLAVIIGTASSCAHWFSSAKGTTQGDHASRRDATFLCCWFLSALLLGAFASPFLAMRRVVEATLPAWILLIRNGIARRARQRLLTSAGVVMNGVIAVAVAAADYEFAAVYPDFAAQLRNMTQANPSRVWCHGYWGWSYYTELTGLRRYVMGRELPPEAALLLVPDEVAKPATLPDDFRSRLKKVHEELIGGSIPVRVMNHRAGAGYYATSWGPLPYAWSRMPLEVFTFYEIEWSANSPRR